jgi:hypothetical protein
MEADFASRYLVPQILGPESLFVIVEREWSDRLKAGLSSADLCRVPEGGLGQGAESDRGWPVALNEYRETRAEQALRILSSSGGRVWGLQGSSV